MLTGNQTALSKRCVFSVWQKMLTVSVCISHSGKEFHSLGAAFLKAFAKKYPHQNN